MSEPPHAPSDTADPDDEADAPAGHPAERLSLTVPPDAAETRIDRWLAEAVPDLSRSRVQTLIRAGHVTVDAATISEPKTPVKPGSRLVVTVPEAAPAAPEAQAIPLSVTYEDSALIVVDKPAGMAVHPAPGTPDGTLVNALLHHCRGSLSGIGGVARPGIVHRLDKDTSGLIVVAKTDAAHQALARQFAERTAGRTYQAAVWGCPQPLEGRIEGAIGRDPRNRKRMAVVGGAAGKPAATRYRVVRRLGPGASLVACTLETGRTHQIRVHMAHAGHPLIGDPVYGRATAARRARLTEPARAAAEAFPRQALHAGALAFTHPDSGETLTFEAPLPADMATLIATLSA